MPAGCDFICKNPNCEQHNNGFTITAPWPMAKIELVISEMSKTIMFKTSNKEILDKIIEFKNSGRKYACITYPNDGNVKKSAYRIQLWSPEAKCIWQYDIEINELNEKSLSSGKLPIKCPKTNGLLLNFNETTNEGINCPYCKEKLFQDRWFTNEN